MPSKPWGLKVLEDRIEQKKLEWAVATGEVVVCAGQLKVLEDARDAMLKGAGKK